MENLWHEAAETFVFASNSASTSFSGANYSEFAISSDDSMTFFPVIFGCDEVEVASYKMR